MQKLLILSDLSETSDSLLRYGLALARHLNAQLWVQHVYYLPPGDAGELYLPEEVLENYEKGVNKKFDQFRKKLPDLSQPSIRFVASYGGLVPKMNELIDQERIDLVLVGHQGGGFLTNVLGSNTVKVVQHAHCPVLSVPKKSEFRPFQRIALAVDLKETRPGSIQRMVTFAQAFQAKVDVIHMSEAPIPVDVKQVVRVWEKALHPLPHQVFYIHTSDVETGIERYIEGNNNDLLVLLPREHSFFDRLFQKSISRQLAYQERVPLLTLHE